MSDVAINNWDIYVSYHKNIRSSIIDLVKIFNNKKYNLKTWLDLEQIKDGEFEANKIIKGIRNSKIFLACVTNEYCKNDECIKEISYAYTSKKPIVVMMIENVSLEDLETVGFLIVNIDHCNTYKDDKFFKTFSGPYFDLLMELINNELKKLKAINTRKNSNVTMTRDDISENKFTSTLISSASNKRHTATNKTETDSITVSNKFSVELSPISSRKASISIPLPKITSIVPATASALSNQSTPQPTPVPIRKSSTPQSAKQANPQVLTQAAPQSNLKRYESTLKINELKQDVSVNNDNRISEEYEEEEEEEEEERSGLNLIIYRFRRVFKNLINCESRYSEDEEEQEEEEEAEDGEEEEQETSFNEPNKNQGSNNNQLSKQMQLVPRATSLTEKPNYFQKIKSVTEFNLNLRYLRRLALLENRNQILTCDVENPSIVALDLEGNYISSFNFDNILKAPCAICVNNNALNPNLNEIYVSDWKLDHIYVYNNTFKYQRELKDVYEVDTAYDMVYDYDTKSVFVSDLNNNIIIVLDGKTGKLVSKININDPRNMFIRNEFLYVLCSADGVATTMNNYDENNSFINVFNKNTNEQINFIELTSLCFIRGLYVDENKNVYTTAYQFDKQKKSVLWNSASLYIFSSVNNFLIIKISLEINGIWDILVHKQRIYFLREKGNPNYIIEFE